MQKWGSDHYLVLMKIQLRMARRQECIRIVRKECIKVEKLRVPRSGECTRPTWPGVGR